MHLEGLPLLEACAALPLVPNQPYREQLGGSQIASVFASTTPRRKAALNDPGSIAGFPTFGSFGKYLKIELNRA